MNEVTSLSDILSDKPPPAPPAEPIAPAEPAVAESQDAAPAEPAEPAIERNKSTRKRHKEKEEAARAEGEGKVRDPETGKFVAKPAEPEPAAAPAAPVAPAVAPAQEFTEKEKAFLRAAQEERNKRQELERRIAAMEKPADAPKAFWDDPDGALKNIESRIEGVAVNTRLNTAEMIARQRHQDFDEKIAVFAEIMQKTPGLYQKWIASQDPAEFAYSTGKNFQEVQKLGGIDAMIKQKETEIAARVRAEVEAEYKAKAEADAKTRAALPGSLSNAHGSPVNRPVWNGPTSLEDILKG